MYLEYKYILDFSEILVLFILLITITCGNNKNVLHSIKYMISFIIFILL